MEWGKEYNNIAWLSMEGSSEERMSQKDEDQKATKEELIRDVSKLLLKTVKELKENYKEGSTLKGQKK